MASLEFLVDDWPTLDRLLNEALDQPPAAREPWLDALPEPVALKDKLRFLLRGEARAETADFLAQLPRLTLPPSGAAAPLPGAAIDACIGPYRLIRELGVGGMGVVWLAERREGGLKRPVALKLPRVGWTRDFVERLHRERDILARLDHPNIARILDAGLDEGGRPYLALEYIEGEPIDAYCRRLALALPQRLQLILQVARAVAHAHARLVVHRDLKPANILVTPGGEVRLLDFGIAKLLEGERTRETELTALGGRALTLDYASPEQVRGEPLSAASDVYSLGVVAYELLAGCKPYQLKRQTAAALEEAIASVDVRPASTATSDPAARRALRGDLDAILNRALKKDVAQRYPTVDALAQDIERHLQQRPVLAQPDAMGYRARKFLRRNALPLMAAGAIVAMLIAGLSVALWQAYEARAQARRAEAVQAFIKQIFSASDPEQARGTELSARQLLNRGAGRLATDLKDQPEVQAELEHTIGDILLAQGANPDAKPRLEKAIALYERLGRGDGDKAAAARLTLSDVLINEAQWAAAATLAQQALAAAQSRSGPSPRWALHARSNLAFIEAQQGRPQAAAEALELALAQHRRGGFGPSAETADAEADLGHAYIALEQYRSAQQAFERSVAEADAAPDATTKQRLIARMYLQYARYFLGQYEAVAQDLPALVGELERHLGGQDGSTLSARTLWAQVLVARGDDRQGVAMQEGNVAFAQQRRTLDGDTLAFQRGVLARLLQQASRCDEGIGIAQQALAFMDAKRSKPNWTAESVRSVLGELQRCAGQPEAAMRTLNLTYERLQGVAGHERSNRYAALLKFRALAAHDLGREREATEGLQTALSVLRARGMDEPDTANTVLLAAWLAAWQRPGDATLQENFERLARGYATAHRPEHLSQVQLPLLRADLRRRGGDSSAAEAEWSAATSAWKARTGLDRPPPPSVLNP